MVYRYPMSKVVDQASVCKRLHELVKKTDTTLLIIKIMIYTLIEIQHFMSFLIRSVLNGHLYPHHSFISIIGIISVSSCVAGKCVIPFKV